MRKAGIPIRVTYKASGNLTGKTVKMDVFDETDVIDPTQSVDMAVSHGRIYRDIFTPDNTGTWRVECYVQDDVTSEITGIVIKDWEVVGHSVNSVGDDVNALQSDMTDVLNELDEINDPPMIG